MAPHPSIRPHHLSRVLVTALSLSLGPLTVPAESASTPDLVPASLTAPASVSTQQAISISWSVQNQGSGPTSSAWQDNLYVSTTPTCCAGAINLGGWPRATALAARATYTQAKTITVPNLAAGNYYLILWTNATAALQEERTDNNLRAIPIKVTTPDLVPTALTAPISAAAGQALSVSWTVKNQGAGTAVGIWIDSLYLSPTSTCCVGATALGQSQRSALAAGASYSQVKSVAMPRLAAGSYHLILRIDATDTLYEASEGNNQRAIPITLTTPDLAPTALTAPETAPAGHSVSLSWTVRNQGTGPTIGAWVDKLYLSPTPSCCGAATSLGTWPHSTTLAAGAGYTQTKSVTIPSLPTGNYFVILWTDAAGQVHEADHANNQLAAPIAVTASAPPPSALAISSVNAGRHPVAGTGFSVTVETRDAGGTPRGVSAATAVRLSIHTGAGVLGGTITGTIPAGGSRVTINGTTYTRAESGVVLSASRTSGAALTAGDSTPFTVDPGAIAAYAVALSSPQPIGIAFGITVTARDHFANTVTTDSSTVVTMRSASGHVLFDVNADGVFGDTSKALSGGTLSVNAKGTVAEMTSIIASDARGKTGSAPLTLTAGPPAALAFVTQPANVIAGRVIGGLPTVAVRDAFGNTVTSSSAPITLAIGANPGGGVLGGTRTKAPVAGIARFGDLTISQPGAGYTLTATATGLTSATSTTFTVSAVVGAISGRVARASDGTGLAGASVNALQGGLLKGAATSNPDGTYVMAGLAPGVYAVRASAPGHQPVTHQGVSVTAGGGTTVNFSLAAAQGPTVRITSPSAGSISGSLTVLVRGEIRGVAGIDLGVNVNDMPGFLDDAGDFVALVPVSPAVTTLTAKLSGLAGVLATDSIPFSVQATATEPPIVLRATPSGGVAPLSVVFDLSSRVGVSQVTLDVNGDGAPEYQGLTLSGISFTLAQPGLYPATVTVADLLGQTHTATTIVQVFARPVLDQRLQAVWQGAKDALRAGNVAAAASFIHSDIRDQYQAQFAQLNPATLANVDQIMTSIALVEVGFAGAQYEMLRASDGQIFSYAVWFQVDRDGLWRIRRF